MASAWLTKNNPQKNYRTYQVKLESGHQWTARLATEPSRGTPDVDLYFITEKQARHSLCQGEEGFFAWVFSSDSPEKDVEFNIDATGNQKDELLDLLNGYRDVIPQELPVPHSPPPEGAINRDMDLPVVSGSSPPSRTPYRLPKPLMDKLQKQISTLLG